MQTKRFQWWTGCMGPFLSCIVPELVNNLILSSRSVAHPLIQLSFENPIEKYDLRQIPTMWYV